MKKHLLYLMMLVLLLVTGCCNHAAKDCANDERMDWWREARFGMFIHWGISSVPAGRYNGEHVPNIGEWIMLLAKIPVEEYETYATRFNPVQFDADAWVKLAKDAGMKYIVITSKHHDGFCMWDSKVTEYDIVDATPFQRDVLAELKQACDKHGVKFCLYHSILDWHHPDAQLGNYGINEDREKSNPNYDRYVENYMKPQLKELIEKYDPGVLWFDGEWVKDWTPQRGWDLYYYLRELQPSLIVNNRIGDGRDGMVGFDKDEGNYAGDFGTPEQEIPATGVEGLDWESCMTMNDTWGYKIDDPNWKSSEVLIHNLVDIASKGGNFLLNIGPKSDGTIPQASIERLETIAKWMKVNSESIHGTTASEIGSVSWGRSTTKGKKIYLHVFDWPSDGKLEVPNIEKKPWKVYLLANGQKLQYALSEGSLTIDVPEKALDDMNTVIVVKK